MVDYSICPGCGVSLPKEDNLPEPIFNASRECWKAFSDLSFYTLSLRDNNFLHQTAVDVYEAQHAGKPSKSIVAVFGLVGLYLALEKGYTGRQVQKAHMQLANKNKIWKRLNPSTNKWDITVIDVLKTPESEREEKIIDWGKITWKGWEKEQPYFKEIVTEYLKIN